MNRSMCWLALGLAMALSPQLARAQLFDFETDFSTVSNPTGAWSYRYQANGVPNNTVRDGSYELLTDYHANSFGGAGFDVWHPPASGSLGLPGVGKNNGGAPFLGIPPGAGWAHTNPSQIAVISWTAPADGTADVSFLFSDADAGGGNGIKYFVERGNSEFTIRQAAIANGDGSGAVAVPGSLRVKAGETVNFIVDPNGGDHGSDSTRVSAAVNFSAAAATTTDYRAAADLIAYEAGASGPQSATGINGVWSYGTSATNGGAFTLYAVTDHTDAWFGNATFQGWAEVTGPIVPTALVNTLATPQSPCCGIPAVDPDQMFLHPGPGNANDANGTRDFSIVRWTAPSDGTIDLSAIWVQKHGNQAEIDALLNGVSLFPAGDQLATPGDGTLLSMLELVVAAGDTIDFLVGPNPVSQNFSEGTTGFDANIRFTAAVVTELVPESATLAQWTLCGLVAAISMLYWRRRKAHN